MNIVSQKMRRPIINWLIKSDVSKRELAEALGVSRQRLLIGQRIIQRM